MRIAGLAALLFLAVPVAAARPASRLVYGATPPQLATPPGERLRDALASPPLEVPADTATAPPIEEKLSPLPRPEDRGAISAAAREQRLVLAGRAAWVKTPSSLLLYDSSGTLVDEIGLGQWEETGEAPTAMRRTVRGGISPDGRFAWSWEKADNVRLGRNEKTLSSARLMRYIGTAGSELFRNELADAPPGLEPVMVSENGETIIIHEHGSNAWIVAVYDFTGNRLFDARGKGSVEFAQLAPGEAFGLIRWHQLDQPPVYTILNLRRRSNTDIPGAGLTGSPRITSDGRLIVGDKVVFQPK